MGCGTSWHMAGSYAAAREAAGAGETDAFTASEMPAGPSVRPAWWPSRARVRPPRWCGCSVDLPERIPSVVITAVPGSPVTAGGRTPRCCWISPTRTSVVQTRFATTALDAAAGQRSGSRPQAESDAAALALRRRCPKGWPSYRRIVFLGAGWTIGLAAEAALKLREAGGRLDRVLPGHGIPPRPDHRRLGRDAGVADRRRRPDRAGRGRRRRLDHRPNRRSTARLAGTGPAGSGRACPRPRARSRPPPST